MAAAEGLSAEAGPVPGLARVETVLDLRAAEWAWTISGVDK